MSYSKLKPYNLIGAQNRLDRVGRKRFYGSGLSLRGTLSFAARYLKEKGKESVYEKPYLQLSRPLMHLDWPMPDWHIIPPRVGQYPPNDGTYHTYIFSPGIVSIFVQGPAECGETVRGFAGVSLQGPHSRDARNAWKFTSSDDRARVVNVKYFPPITQHSADFDVEVDEVSEELEVQICAKVALQGDLIRAVTGPKTGAGAIQVPMPGVFGTPDQPPTVPTQPLDVWEDYEYPEECADLTLEPCVCTEATWDSGDDVTLGQSDDVVVSITSTPPNSPKTWNISGTGFWFDAGYTVTSLETDANSVTVYTDGSACGSGTITVCGVTGYVRCTTGKWVVDTHCSNFANCGGGCGTAGCEGTQGAAFKYHDQYCHMLVNVCGVCILLPQTCTEYGAYGDCLANFRCSHHYSTLCEWVCAADPRAGCTF